MAKDIVINFKGNMDVSDIKNSINTVQTTLGKLKLPNDLSKNLTDGFSKAEDAIAQIERRLSNGFKTKSDVTGIAKDFDKLEGVIEGLNKHIAKISDNHIKISIDTTEIKKAEKTVANIQKQLNQRIEANGLQEVNKAVKELGEGISKSKAIEEFQNAFKSGNIEEASKALEKLRTNADLFSNASRKITYKEKIEALANALQNLEKDQAFKKLSQDSHNAENSVKQLQQQAIDKLKGSIGSATTEMSKLPPAIRQSRDAAVEAGQGIQKMNSICCS